MSESLPVGNFKEIKNIDKPIESYLNECNDEYGMIFEVDLEYEQIKVKHRLYPLAPEREKRNYEELSEYQKSLITGTYNSVPKLVLDLQPKKNYVVHYRNLNLYLNSGMKVTEIHQILTFKQSKWLAEYISHNTKRRIESENEKK